MNGKQALLTGFLPYGGRGVNPSAEVVARLDGAEMDGGRVVGRVIPVSYRTLREHVEALLDELQPALVVSLGLWPGEPMVRLERIAINLAEFEIPDNEGHLASDSAVVPEAAPGHFASLPLSRIERRLLEAGIPATQSSTAGTFLCNATLYAFLEGLARRQRNVPCGFVHLPYLPGQVAGLLAELREQRTLEKHQRADLASMSLDTMVEAVRIVLETSFPA